MKCSVLSLVTALAVLVAPFAAADDAGTAQDAGTGEDLASMVKPEYTKRGELMRPTDFREWVFVGASLGLSYNAAKPDGPGAFHHIYMQPEAYRHYRDTGEFPEKTMLVMENYSAGSKENNTAKGTVEGDVEFENLHGHFEDKRVGMEVALKDSEQFEDTWAYFMFEMPNMPARDVAKPFPKSMCFDCHDSHAADDNVFVQFYPVLREHFEARLGITTDAPADTPEYDPGTGEE